MRIIIMDLFCIRSDLSLITTQSHSSSEFCSGRCKDESEYQWYSRSTCFQHPVPAVYGYGKKPYTISYGSGGPGYPYE